MNINDFVLWLPNAMTVGAVFIFGAIGLWMTIYGTYSVITANDTNDDITSGAFSIMGGFILLATTFALAIVGNII